MHIAVILFGVAGLFAAAAQLAGPWGFGLWWVAAASILVAKAYLIPWPGVMGKRPDGVVPWYRSAIVFPYVLFTILMGNLKSWLSKERVWDQVAPTVFVGRRCSVDELPAGTQIVVDLTCERTEPQGLREAPTYYCLPTLDGTAPGRRAYRALLDRLIPDARPMYIHCAMGHSRSATVAAGVLIGRGVVQTVAAAEELMKRDRPKVHLTRTQRALVEELAREFWPQENPSRV